MRNILTDVNGCVSFSPCLDYTNGKLNNPSLRLDIHLKTGELINCIRRHGEELFLHNLLTLIRGRIEAEVSNPENQTNYKMSSSILAFYRMAERIERLDPDKMTVTENEIAKELEDMGTIELRTDPVSYESAWRIKG